jgi:hypothetical protein
LSEIDSEYYEINTKNKEVINNPVVQKDSFFDLKAAAISNTIVDVCTGKENWDKKAL